MAIRHAKYNPAFLGDEGLIRCFVVRHADFEMILRIVRENAGRTNQHVLVIGPRGIGKTMLALRVVAEVRREKDLRDKWYAIVFGEESYQVCTPGEFWLEAIFHLAGHTQDKRWQRTHQELSAERDETRLRQRALGQLLDFADAQGKRLLLVVENFNMLVGNQLGGDDGWVLRHTLEHESRIMLLATATSRFPEAHRESEAMYELFHTHTLGPLNQDECRAVWISITGQEPLDNRIRPIQILTGGNPRLLAIISSFGAEFSFHQLLHDLMKLVDENTEYFKTHLDHLAPVERKVYLALAELWDPVRAREVARLARLEVSKTSSLLIRLVSRGAVTVYDASGRAKWYQVAERMYNVYYLMRRRGGNARRVQALVNFMVGLYGPEELVRLTRAIAAEACSLAPPSRQDHFLAYEALLKTRAAQPVRDQLLKATPREFLGARDAPASLRALAAGALVGAEPEVRRLLKRAAELTRQPAKVEEAERLYREAIESAPQCVPAWVGLGVFLHVHRRKHRKAESAFRKAIDMDPGYSRAWAGLGLVLDQGLGRYVEAEKAYRRAVEIDPQATPVWVRLGELLRDPLARYEDAEQGYRKAVEIDPKYAPAWVGLGLLLDEHLGRYDDAEHAYRKAIEIDPKCVPAWAGLGSVLHEHLGRYDDAEQAYRKVIDLGSMGAWAWARLGLLLHLHLGRYEEAEQAYRKAIKVDAKCAPAWAGLALLLHEHLGRYEEAEQAYRKAIEVDAKCAPAWAGLALVLHKHLGRYEEAEQAYRKALDIDPKSAWAWARLGLLLHERLDRYEEAENAYRRATELEPKVAWGWAKLAQLLHEQLGRSEEGVAAYRKAIEADPRHAAAWAGLVPILSKLGRAQEATALAEQQLAENPDDADLLNSLAWDFFKYGGSCHLAPAETWSRKAVALEPTRAAFQRTLAGILCAEGKATEALAAARESLQDPSSVEKWVDEAIELFVELAARGAAAEALDILRESPSVGMLEPLVVGLQLYLGQDVRAAAEILEVGKDVAERIRQWRDRSRIQEAGDQPLSAGQD